MPFNSRLTNIYQGSDLNEIVDEMPPHMNMQIDNPAFTNSRFRFEEVMHIRIYFYQLNLTRGSSYIPLPSWIVNKKAVINAKNEDDEGCSKWAVTIALHHKAMGKDPQCVTKIKYINNYDWSALEFPVAIKKIGVFEKNNNISVNVLGERVKQIYPPRISKYSGQKVVNLLLITHGNKWHYTAIKDVSSLIGNSNSKYVHKQHICMNCLQGFTLRRAEMITLNTAKTTKQ